MIRPFRELEFRGVVEEKKHTDGRDIYRAVATTPALDRYGEVVLPKGAVVDNFMKNPVLLELHNYGASSVGHVVNLDIQDDIMTFDFVFSTDQRGMDLEAKYKAGDMNAFSIGFKPKNVINIWNPWDDAPEIKEIKIDVAGKDVVLDLTQYEHIPYCIYNSWELLEISPVSVPANPEALLMREAEEIIRRTMDKNPAMRSFVQDDLRRSIAPVLDMLAAFQARYVGQDITFSGVVEMHSTPTEDSAWSGATARTALAKWASKDGTGKKEDINWAKFSKGFAWFDSTKADSFGAYTLLHHTVKDDSLVAVWKGVVAAMAALLRDGAGVSEDQKSTVYAHLAKHYADFGKEAPELKEYTEEELTAIEEMALNAQSALEAVSEEKAEETPPAEDPESDEPMPGNIDAKLDKVVEMLSAIAQAISKLADDEEDAEETQQEHFIELQLKTETMLNILERGAVPHKKEEKKETPQPTEGVVADVSLGLIADLERVVTLE